VDILGVDRVPVTRHRCQQRFMYTRTYQMFQIIESGSLGSNLPGAAMLPFVKPTREGAENRMVEPKNEIPSFIFKKLSGQQRKQTVGIPRGYAEIRAYSDVEINVGSTG